MTRPFKSPGGGRDGGVAVATFDGGTLRYRQHAVVTRILAQTNRYGDAALFQALGEAGAPSGPLRRFGKAIVRRPRPMLAPGRNATFGHSHPAIP